MRRERASSQRNPKQASTQALKRDKGIVRRICTWFAASARDLPWRAVDPKTGRRDPYRSLVSEFMLQQTQVSRVLEKFEPFLARFPDVAALAKADLGEVLSAWSGLGYYRRARHLHGAAKAVMNDFDAQVPQVIERLMSLPGVGRYTAGAIASMVFGQPQPLVDGNVARVLLRVEGRELSAPEGLAWAWTRAT
jgi:A/G-specific adenine glycosylase